MLCSYDAEHALIISSSFSATLWAEPCSPNHLMPAGLDSFTFGLTNMNRSICKRLSIIYSTLLYFCGAFFSYGGYLHYRCKLISYLFPLPRIRGARSPQLRIFNVGAEGDCLLKLSICCIRMVSIYFYPAWTSCGVGRGYCFALSKSRKMEGYPADKVFTKAICSRAFG